uniref:Hypothetical chloroplast RF1 n=1 Tax=Androcymbium greuterocymbium TaxID=481254 RepID=A0A7D3Q9C6_9LILI|nr:hypothetical chloroplast RF1 [Androcymbium greuterocymbium]QKE31260.1 hypothetical chloroplast RF1 [Androcymbium greuterocymbium]
MILKSFLLGNLLSLCMKIINSVVVVGLYYGFLTTFSIGPSYLFLLRARVMEEGTEKEVSATTGFITGQLMMFISIYYAPLHLALGRPHTITVLVLPYLLFHFFWNNQKNLFDYGSTTRNSMRNLSIQCVFLNNLIFQLFNHFILPSSTLTRLVNIYMFRCNNKMLFVTSSFVGWLIGHILFMKWVGLVLFWIRQNRSIRFHKYFVAELRNSMAQIFSILLFITCVYYLGRMPSPIFTKKVKEKETEEWEEGEEEKENPDKIDKTEEIQVNGKEKTKDEFHKDSPVYENYYLDTHQDNWELRRLKEDQNEKTHFRFEKPLVTFLFDYQRWNHPLRYIKNGRFDHAVRNKISQYFFYICPSDGKQIISFTYPPSLSTFSEMIEAKISLYTTEKLYNEDLYNYWLYTNEQKKYNLRNELRNRIKVLEKERGSPVLDLLEKRIRLYNDENEQECLSKIHDPFLNGPYRGTIKKLYSNTNINDLITFAKDSIQIFWINKIYSLLSDNKNYNYFGEFEHQKNLLNRESLQKRVDLESQAKYLKFLFDVITTDPHDQRTIRNKSVEIEEIRKNFSQWSYKLISDLEELNQEDAEDSDSTESPGIRSRKAKRVVIYTDNDQNTDSVTSTNNTTNTSTSDQTEEVALIRYSQQSDFRRDLIKGSMRAQRRKTVIWEMFQANAHSPLFLDRIDKRFLFSYLDISEIKNIFFRNWIGRESELKISDLGLELEKEETKEKEKDEENERIAISETWDSIIFAQAIRGLMLITQSFLRKYIVLPFLIIVKNVVRMLLLQLPEWGEDFKEWNREIHVKCTYNGVQLSQTEFPKDWLTDGIQIKILFPFCLKPWRRSKVRSTHRDSTKIKIKKENFCFLTIWGMEVELPFGSPQKRTSFFEPIGKELKRKFRKVKKIFFLALRVLKEIRKGSPQISKEKKEKTQWVMKIILVIKRIIKEFEKVNPILLFELRKVKVDEPNEKDSKINNQIHHESTTQIRSMNWTNYSLIEKKMKDLSDRIITIRNQLKGITKEKKKKKIITYDDKRLESQKYIWQILKKNNTRLIRKLHYFMKSLIEKVYMDIVLCTINIPRTRVQLFFESTTTKKIKKMINKLIYNDETSQEEIDETNKNTMNFISIIKNAFSNTNNNLNNYYDLSFLSQTYVFYKLSQTQLLNKYQLRSVLQDHGAHHYLRDIIKDYYITLGIFDYASRHKKMKKSEINEWKNCLKGHSQYNLSQTEWSRLVPKKWRNSINQRRTIQNQEPMKFYLYKKDSFLVDLLMNKKEKVKKHYRYDLLLKKYMNCGDNEDSYISGSTLQVTRNGEIPYNFNTSKFNSFYILVSTAISNYLEAKYIIGADKNLDRKYLDCRIIKFCLKKNINSDTLTNARIGAKIDNIKINQKTKTGIKKYQTYKEINLSKKKKKLFDWMGMNNEKLYHNRTISYLKSWFLPELVIFFDTYKIKPWIIPIQLLLFDSYRNANFSYILTNQKEYLELKNANQEKNEQQGKRGLGSDLRQENTEKYVQEDSSQSNIKGYKKKKKFKSNKEAELYLFLSKYFLFQLRWGDPLNKTVIENIKVYCLLLRLMDPREISISSIKRGEMRLDIMLIKKDLTIKELIKGGIFVIEPIRLSRERNGHFFIYQTISISLVDANKDQSKTNRKYKKKIYVNKKNLNNFDRSVVQHSTTLLNLEKIYYDFPVPENILSPRRRRELRILILLNSRNVNVLDKNPIFCNENKIKNCRQFINEDKYVNTDANIFIKFKQFLWPNYLLEDLACMNRYWFDTNNGSHFSMLRIHMYPRF